MLDVGYILEVTDHTQSKEMFDLCPFWDLSRSCGM